MEAEPVKPTFGVSEGESDVRPAESFSPSRVVVGSQASMDIGSLFGCEEGGCGGVVGNECVGGYRDEDGEQAFEDEDPSPAVEAANTFHECYALRRLVSFLPLRKIRRRYHT